MTIEVGQNNIPERQKIVGQQNNLASLLAEDYDNKLNFAEDKKIINNCSLDDLVIFLRNEFNNFANKDKAPQPLVDLLLEKFFSDYEKLPEEKKDELLIEDTVTSFFENKHENREVDDDQTITDKAFISFLKLCKKYPSASLDFWHDFSAGATNSVRPDLLVKGLAELNKDKELDQSLFKDNLIDTFLEGYAVGYKNVNKGIVAALDFEHPDNYGETVEVIDFLKKLHSHAEYLDDRRPFYASWSDSRQAQTEIKKALTEKINSRQGSYILNLHAQEYLKEMASWEEATESQKRLKILENKNQPPFALAPGVTGYFEDNTLYRSVNGKNTMEPLNINDIRFASSNQEKSSEDEKFLADFSFLSKPDIRLIIFKDLGIKLSDLPLKQQAYFSQYLVSRPEKEIGPLKEFIGKYGANGLNTFLSLENRGRDMGNTIINIGRSLENSPESARELFAEYTTMVNSAERAAGDII